MTSSEATLPTFELEVPDSRSDRVTTLRREVKFALPHVDFGKFLSILEVNCRRVSYAQPTSRVASLYFDDVLLSSCHDNLDGTPRRSKLRLRWYDTPLPETKFFFEVKRRADDTMTKSGFRFALRWLSPRSRFVKSSRRYLGRSRRPRPSSSARATSRSSLPNMKGTISKRSESRSG